VGEVSFLTTLAERPATGRFKSVGSTDNTASPLKNTRVSQSSLEAPCGQGDRCGWGGGGVVSHDTYPAYSNGWVGLLKDEKNHPIEWFERINKLFLI
jgi:hypothetical protein